MTRPLGHVEYDDPDIQRAWDEHQARTHPHCEFCHQPVDPGVDFRRVNGWVKGGSSDGFKRDHYEDEWAHKHCIEIHKTVGAGQESLNV